MIWLGSVLLSLHLSHLLDLFVIGIMWTESASWVGWAIKFHVCNFSTTRFIKHDTHWIRRLDGWGGERKIGWQLKLLQYFSFGKKNGDSVGQFLWAAVKSRPKRRQALAPLKKKTIVDGNKNGRISKVSCAAKRQHSYKVRCRSRTRVESTYRSSFQHTGK